MVGIIPSTAVIITDIFLFSYLLGWFFSADWFDNLQQAETEDDITTVQGFNITMGFGIVCAIIDCMVLYYIGTDNLIHFIFTFMSYVFLSVLFGCVLMDMRTLIRTKRGKE